MSTLVQPGRPAAFLDRDGVINIDLGYVFRPADLVFTPTAIEGISLLNSAGYLVIVVTNQSGVARGLYEETDIVHFHDHMQALLGREGARIDAFYHCAYHPDGTVERYAREHEDRKPNPGMLLRAMRDWSIRADRSFMIGDKPTDVEVATRAGINSLLVSTNDCDLAAAVTSMLAAVPVATAADRLTVPGDDWGAA